MLGKRIGMREFGGTSNLMLAWRQAGDQQSSNVLFCILFDTVCFL